MTYEASIQLHFIKLSITLKFEEPLFFMLINGIIFMTNIKLEGNKMKKKEIIILAIFFCVGILFGNKIVKQLNNLSNNKFTNHAFKVSLETSAGSKTYKETLVSSYPTKGYQLNSTKSNCTQGGSVSQLNNYTVTFVGNNPSDCDLFFDIGKLHTITYKDEANAAFSGELDENDVTEYQKILLQSFQSLIKKNINSADGI